MALALDVRPARLPSSPHMSIPPSHHHPTLSTPEMDSDANHAEAEAEIGDDNLENAARSKVEMLAVEQRSRQAVFDDWFLQKAQTTDVTLTPITRSRRHDHSADQGESLKEMLQKHEDVKRIIGSERAYQTELFERAKAQNTVAVLDTGSGKTLIAILLMRHVLDREVEDRAAGKPRRIAVFLVEKVTLMFQQAAVLRANLSFPLAELCGDMGVDLWSRSKWAEILANNDYIVCTADVLLFCLMRSFLDLHDISLLIFDEAHHAKKGHPYARIMQDFYPRSPKPDQMLPRIFGMTASPVDIEGIEIIEDKAYELEDILHSKIATTARSELDAYISRPRESIVEYDEKAFHSQRYSIFATTLYNSLHAKYYDLTYFRGLFEKAAKIRSALGPWCSDMYWRHAFSDAASKKLQQKFQNHSKDLQKLIALPEDKQSTEAMHSADRKSQEYLDRQINDLQQAAADINDHKIAQIDTSHAYLSEKILQLHGILAEYYERETDARCLVFVAEKITARLLCDVFERIGGPHMKPGYLVGSTARALDDIKHTFKDQFATLIKFRKGELNCLFATAVAEEGLDVADCNLIVRFDPCTTMIQYIQSRGRARAKQSRFIHLVLKEDKDMAQDKIKDIHECEERMRSFCGDELEKDRMLLGDGVTEDDLSKTPQVVDVSTPVRDKKTGARVTLFFSMVVLNHFIDCVPRDPDEDMSVSYAIMYEGRQFRCEITFPDRAMIPSIIGNAHPRKIMAKMSAALEAVRYLYNKKLLDEHFLPTAKKDQHLLRNARLALKTKEKSGYECQLKPTLWEKDRGTLPTQLFATQISLCSQWDRQTRPLMLLTRHPLPALPEFPLYRLDNEPVLVRLESLTDPLKVNELDVEQLTWFMLIMFKDVFNKSFEHSAAKMSYWLAPLKDSESGDAARHRRIDWQLLNDMYTKTSAEWQPDQNPKSWVDRFLVDPYHGGRRYFTKRYMPDLKAGDSVPVVGVPGAKPGMSILDYTSSLWARSKARKTWDEHQPVFEADGIQHRLNVLATANASEQKFHHSCYICVEPLRASRLPVPVVGMLLLFPAIIHRIESYLIAVEFVAIRNLDIRPELALEALTKDSDNSEEHGQDKINVQHGMGRNYERFEFLGDVFLKMATTISTFMRNPTKLEHWMHPERMALLCNLNLMNNAVANNVPRYIRATAFSRRTWYPENLKLLEGKGSKKQGESKLVNKLSGKTVADVCEATIGAAFFTHIKTGYEDTTCFDNAVRAVTAFVSNKDLKKHDMDCWADYSKVYQIPKWQDDMSSAAELRVAEIIRRESHSYTFKRPKLLFSALTHPSLPSSYSNVPNYQRLEFLGDSLLDMTSVWHLFTKHPNEDPGWLTDHKTPMVANKFMGALCAQLGLHRHMRHQSAILQKQLTAYMTEFNEANGEEGRPVDFWQDLKDPPKFMADLVEAYVGAMFVDSNFEYAQVQRFFDTHVAPFFADMSVYDSFANNHPINKLRERLEVQLGCENWRVMCGALESDDGRSRAILATVVIHRKTLGFHQASTDKVARFFVAKEASELLEGMTPTDFRAAYGCRCSNEVIDEEEGLEGPGDDQTIE